MKETLCIMNLCMAATYDPDRGRRSAPRAAQPRVGRGDRGALEEVARTRPDQPRREIPDNLKSLRGIYIDCGWRDQYHIQIRIAHPVRTPRPAGIRNRYEEFDDDHSDVDYRIGRELAVSLQGVEALRTRFGTT